MPIIVGSTVKLTSDDKLVGRVLAVDGETITWMPASTGVERDTAEGLLENISK